MLALTSSSNVEFSSSRSLFSDDDDDDCNVVEAARAYWHSMAKEDHAAVAGLYHRNAVSYRNGALNLNSGRPDSVAQRTCVTQRLDSRRVLQSIGRDSKEGRHVSLAYDLYVDDAAPIPVVHSLEFDRATCSISVERMFHETSSPGFKRFVARTVEDCYGEAALDGAAVDDLGAIEQCWASFVNEDASELANCFSDDAVWYVNGMQQGVDALTAEYWQAYFDAVEVHSAEVVLSVRDFSESRVSVLVEWTYSVRGEDGEHTVFTAQNVQFDDDAKIASVSQVDSNTQPAMKALGTYAVEVPSMLTTFADAGAAFAYADVTNIMGVASYVVPGEVAVWEKGGKQYGIAKTVLFDGTVDIAESGAESTSEPTHISVIADVKLGTERAAAAQAIPGAVYTRSKQELSARGATFGHALVNLYYAMAAANGEDLQTLWNTRSDAIASIYKYEAGAIVYDEDGSVQYQNSVVNSYGAKLLALVNKY